ncbi:winged helix-turn-helix domain-containing protein [Stackebrandtia nassauensis]|uniref:Transcriptional regulator, GntR family n=1 Tax=Stackebrandtia nassauensis (strain DSM 44728 / CIP 108903 / NRRL B-16338 / NBRC 102104 / LLR-40K-21) TaxID=446470 RepID=D3Q377_STANL|nr:winged helix-turn-helix domain-containing protein [Stackebrandtia nassauensis]ADD40047.1 transcriptional regulator, GntR family [Stackebrandtia nassauensis DSM 44728]
MPDAGEFRGERDPESPLPPKVQIANQLRAAILTGVFQPGDKLPSQPELSRMYKTSRQTAKNGLEILAAERIIVMGQGSNARVRAITQRSVELRPHVEAAFEQGHVVIDFAGFSSETLRGVLSEPLDKIRVGRFTPESITVRILITDVSKPIALPVPAETGTDDPDVRARSARITGRAVDGIVDQIHELGDLGLVKTASAEVRVHDLGPMFKLYLISRQEAFFGFYPVVEHTVPIKREPTPIYDLMGKDVPLFHYAVSDDDATHGAQFVEAAQTWFDSVWTTIARERESE